MAWTSPRTWVAGETVTAALLNIHLRDNLKAVGDAWTAYTPTTTGITLGNGTLTGHYSRPGQTVKFRIKLVFGSTTVLTGSPMFSLPVAAIAVRSFGGTVTMLDDSASALKGGFYWNSTATALAVRDDASAALSSTNPFTWATNDEISISGSYEPA